MPCTAIRKRPPNPWLQQLRTDPLPWLLEESNPAVRWQALRYLLDRPEEEPAVQWARAGIASWEPVQAILACQLDDGSWKTPAGTARVLWLLAKIGLPAGHPAAGRACRYLMQSLNTDGSFCGMLRPTGVAWPWRRQAPCLPGLAIFALLRFGWGGDARVQAAINHLAERTLADSWKCQGRREGPCWWAAACTLRALAETGDRSGPVAEAMDRAIELLLSVPYWDIAHPAARDPRWTAFSFPLFERADMLEVALLMSRLERGSDPRLAEVRALIAGKQDEDGRWASEGKPENALPVSLSLLEPDKWVTLRALLVLKSSG